MSDTIDWNDDPRLVAYALGELDADGREEIDRALLSDPACRAALDEITAFLPEVERAVRVGGADIGLASEAHATIAAAARRGPVRGGAVRGGAVRGPKTWARPALAAAASLLVTTLVVGRLLDKAQPPDVAVATADAGDVAGKSDADWRFQRQSESSESAAEAVMGRPSVGQSSEPARDAAKMAKRRGREGVPADSVQDRPVGAPLPGARSDAGVNAPEPPPSEEIFTVEFTHVESEQAPSPRSAPADSTRSAVTLGEEEITLEDDRALDLDDEAPSGESATDTSEDELALLLEARLERVRLVVPENAFVLAKEDPLSTFSIDVDTASYTNVRRSISGGRLPSLSAVRVEEFVNYFSYDDAPPAADDPHPFAVRVESGAAPWMPQHRLVRISLKGRAIDFGEREPANLVFLVDVSGSMNADDKLPLVKKALALLTGTLDPRDRVAIVVYASAQGLALPSTPVAAREAILQSLERLDAGGSTNGGAGIELAYAVATENFVAGGVNRVILCTDGDFNVGVTSDQGLEELIAEKARSGIDLTVLGFGTGNFKDAKMEALSNRGNGNFAYLDSEYEARKVLVTEVGGTLNTIARDVKLQVVWNPSRVQAFRLIGYENRMLEHRDFADDAKDAGEIGAGHGVTALYEVVPWGVAFDIERAAGAKPDPAALDAAGGAPVTGPFVTVRLRYKPPGEDASLEFEMTGIDGGASFDGAPESLRFAAAVAAFGMILRESSHVGGATLRDVRRWALESLGDDPGGLRAGFVELVDKAIELGR